MCLFVSHVFNEPIMNAFLIYNQMNIDGPINGSKYGLYRNHRHISILVPYSLSRKSHK